MLFKILGKAKIVPFISNHTNSAIAVCISLYLYLDKNNNIIRNHIHTQTDIHAYDFELKFFSHICEAHGNHVPYQSKLLLRGVVDITIKYVHDFFCPFPNILPSVDGCKQPLLSMGALLRTPRSFSQFQFAPDGGHVIRIRQLCG